MKLVSFSVENYRSITTARKIPLSDYSLLIGANNEGKSNILHALTLGMRALVELQRQVRRASDWRAIRNRSSFAMGYHSRGIYDWEADFPVSKQEKALSTNLSTSTTNITLEFELDETETQEFKEEIESNLNGTLPLMISFGQRNFFGVSVKKQGRGQATFAKKSVKIVAFVSQRIRFEYIPAIRTAESATEVISQLVERELFHLEHDPEYSGALAKIEKLQQPVLDELAKTIQSTVSSFLPNVKSIKLKSQRETRYRSLRQDVEIVVDDGNLTRLERKGDGVQSLVALALMRHASEQSTNVGSTVIAIEEPESHLHSKAVHELRTVIQNLAVNNQVILTSHSPLFVDPDNLRNTIIVKGSKAAPARHVSAIRNALGVRFSDNLENARMVFLVEGTDDVTALKAIVTARSEPLARAIKNRTIIFDHLGGASALRQKASIYQASACLIQCFIDDDGAGRDAVKRAVDDKVLALCDVNLCTVPHLDEAELEDLYNKSIYASDFHTKFGVDPKTKPLYQKKEKWSNVIERLFNEADKPWDRKVKTAIKNWLAEFAAKHPDDILQDRLAGPINSFIATAEEKLPTDKK